MNVIHKFSEWSYRRLLVFWWMLFLLVQQVDRVFLLPTTWSMESPSLGVLANTFWVGFRADLIIATIGVFLAALVGALFAIPLSLLSKRYACIPQTGGALNTGFLTSSILVGLLIGGLLLVDMGYYFFNKHHLDFVFFEYVEDLVLQTKEVGVEAAQAVNQTEAELQDSGKWAGRFLAFVILQLGMIVVWWWCFTQVLAPRLSQWGSGFPFLTNFVLLLVLAGSSVGFHHKGPTAIRSAEIGSGTFYTLSQNPILYASEALRASLESRRKDGQLLGLTSMPVDEAMRVTQEMIGQGASYPHTRYPLVRITQESDGVRLAEPANVLIILIEALDRRFLGREIQGVRVTPFLDRLRKDSVYFQNFFSNGVQTSRGQFATLCSYYPRQGHSAMKYLYAHDFLCLPSLLQRGGYQTEMVISEAGDLNRLRLFLANNGLHRLYDVTDFPEEVEAIGSGPSLGKSDGALLDLVQTRIDSLQAAARPWFLATMTLGTHHPFTIPVQNPEITRLMKHPDGYVAALRYLDQELERFFSELLDLGLLKNTMVFILGDHGRHERIGPHELEQQVGHFMAPLFIWMDESLRTPETFQPRSVATVASQVDLVPTIVAMNGLMPRVSPFLGRDLSCVLIRDCLEDNFSFLTSVYDDLIGFVDSEGLLLYSLRTGSLRDVDLNAQKETDLLPTIKEPEVASRYRNLLALYVSSNRILSRNAIWSWQDLGGTL